tara:strand:+ start:562 stop:666 length:105 start_codon:yes stop_codon:yes gene_type:complete
MNDSLAQPQVKQSALLVEYFLKQVPWPLQLFVED